MASALIVARGGRRTGAGRRPTVGSGTQISIRLSDDSIHKIDSIMVAINDIGGIFGRPATRSDAIRMAIDNFAHCQHKVDTE